MVADLSKIGVSGLFASKKSLETAGHNIANANTEGYSRQRTLQQTNPPIGTGNIVHGAGARVTKINRVHDPLVEQQFNDSVTSFNYNKERANLLNQVQDIFNEFNNDGLYLTMNQFFNSFRELANNPEDETIRSVVREKAKATMGDFKRIRSRLEEITNYMGNKLTTQVKDANLIAEKIANLNVKIAQLEVNQGETGDLRDEREMAVRDLSEMFDVHVYADEKNKFFVQIVNVGTVVAGENVQPLVALKSDIGRSTNEQDGSVEVFYQNRLITPISDKMKEGAMGGLFDVRNVHVKKLINQLDNLAFHFANSVNAIHRRGYTNRPVELDEQGRAIASANEAPITGIDFFKAPTQVKNASGMLELSNEVKSDLSNITTALKPNSPGDNRVAIAISKLQHEKILNNETTTLEEEYLKSIGDIGLEAKKANFEQEQSEGIMAQVKAIKERISGVSLDEETANMIKFQHAYEASAKVIKTAEEMFKTVIGMSR